MMDPQVRPARASDRAPLMSFIKDVWGGHDYIPYVWDAWLREKGSRMFVVVVDGTPVGMNKVSFPEDGSAWLQGARVHPAFRRRGLATMLGENSMKVARERGAKVFRLTTSSRNFASMKQATGMGFREVARFVIYSPPKRFRSRGSDPRPATGPEAAEVQGLVRRSKEFQLGAGLYWHDFAAASLTPDVTRGLIRKGAVWRLRKAVAVAGVGGEGRERWEEISFAGGPVGDLVPLVESLVGRTKRADARWAFIPRGSPLVPELRKAGFSREFSQVVFERTNG